MGLFRLRGEERGAKERKVDQLTKNKLILIQFYSILLYFSRFFFHPNGAYSANQQTYLGKLSFFLFYYAVCCIVRTAGYKCTHHTQTRIIWVYFLLRQKFSYFEPPPLKEPAIIHSLILSPQRPIGHIRKSLSRFVSISPSLSLSLLFFNFFPPYCVLESKFFVDLLDGFGEW